MNAILFHKVPSFRLTGSLINAIEYFLAGWEHNHELKLFLINGTKTFKRKLLKLIGERYDLTGISDALYNIICLKKFYLPSKQFDSILVLDYMTISHIKGIIRAKNIMIISEKYTEMPKYFLDKSLYPVTYYGEMPFHYKDIEYRMKCLFDRYKPLKDIKRGTYVNTPNNENYLKVQDTFSDLPRPMYFKSKTIPKTHLFECFTHYLYYHADKWFDPHPRLFLECKFYNKQIIYHNPHEIKDGSWFRYHDVLQNGLMNRYLTKDDEIIKELI
jgi:hypothetical protein